MMSRTASRVARAAVARGQMSARAAVVPQAVNKVAAVTIPLRNFSVSGANDFQATGVHTQDMKDVEAMTILWRDTVTGNADDSPKKTAALYADDCMFWGTVSEQVRHTPEHFYDYFDMFARMPKLSMVAYDPEPPRVHYGKFAIHAGAYTFAWEVDGVMKETRARFTFAYRKDADGWKMIEHHSSAMPTAPPSLKPAL